jgi:hypothetical protein
MANRTVLIGDPLDDVVLHERGEPIRQQVLGDPEIALELGEPTNPSKDVAQDQQRPTITDHVEGALDGAIVGRGHSVGTLE